MPEGFRETMLSRERVYSGRVVDLEVDRVRLPDGTESVREVVRHPGAAVIVAIRGDGRILFVQQFRYPAGRVLLELPAGTLEPGEDAQSCAARELAEETGWRPEALHELGSMFTTPGFTDELIHCLLAVDLEPAEDGVARDPDERIRVVSLSPEEALAAVRRGEIQDAKTLAGLLLAQLNGWIRLQTSRVEIND